MDSTKSENTNSEPKLVKTIKKDLKQGDFFKTLRRDFFEIRDFYISAEKEKRLKEMNWAKRVFFLIFWILKSMILKLTPARRILLLLGFICLFMMNVNISDSKSKSNTEIRLNILGGSLILLVLMLELKDKLLARDELEAGRKVQAALMSEESPLFDGWTLWLYTRPANEVCGDLVDFIKLKNDRAGIIMADVAGKGLNAALLTAKLQATVRAYADDFEPVELVSKVNNIFYRDSLRNIFASLLYIELNSKSGSIRFVNAGHLPPLILKPDGIRKIPKGEAALGLMNDTVYNELNDEIQSGDIFIAYSDGITEARNSSGEFYGNDKFVGFLFSLKDLPAKEMGLKIISEIDRFTGDIKANDDLSVIILKRN